jgi:hypothetical protein
VATAGLDDDIDGALEVQEELAKVSGLYGATVKSKTYSVTPNSLSSPRPKCEGSVPGKSPDGRFPHGLPESCVRQQVCRVGNLELQQVGLEPVRCGCMLLHAVCDQVARMYDVLLAGLEGDLMDLAFTAQSEQTTASGVSVTPVGDALDLLARFIHNPVHILSPCLC